MPNRFIEIPSPIVLKDPLTKEDLKAPDGALERWDFKMILSKLMGNPKWGESYANMRSQETIEDAFENARDGWVQLPEDDWTKLKEAAENPRFQVNTPMGSQVVPSLGVHPQLSRQLLPLIRPIIEAKTERPKKE